MLCDQPKGIELQKIEGIEDNKAREKVIQFIISCLPEFQNHFLNIDNEDGLTQELVYILDNNSRHQVPLYGFSREHMEYTSKGNSPQDDIGVRGIQGIIIDTISYANNKPFMVFEAKRLDSKLDHQRKKEYVVGRLKDNKYLNSGGIERFKKEIHGRDLNYVGMIGYLQTDNFDTWFNKINGWIEEEIISPSSKNLIWSTQDILLENQKNSLYYTYNSQHKCRTKEIHMCHIWVNVKN